MTSGAAAAFRSILLATLAVAACGPADPASGAAPANGATTTVPVATANRAVDAAAGAPQGEPKAKIPAFAFDLEPAELNLGTLKPSEDGHAEFAIVNRDTRPLRIINIDGSCDCTSFLWERKEIAPGGRLPVKIEVRAQNRGSKLLTAYVQANDSAVTTKQVTIHYVVLTDLVFQPPRVEFGRRVVGKAATADVVVAYHLAADGQPFPLAPKLVPELPLRFTFGEPAITEVAGKLREVKVPLHLELDGAQPLKPFEAALVFESPSHLPARLAVSGEIHPGWYLDHDQVHLGIVKAGGRARGSARLFYTVDSLELAGLETSVPELTASSSADPDGRSFKIEVGFEPKVAGEFEGEVRVRINRATEPLVIRVKAKVR